MTNPGLDRNDLFAVTLLAPDLTAAAQKEPDFFRRSMGRRPGGLSGGEFEVGHASAFQAQQSPHLGAVGSDGDAAFGQTFWAEVTPVSSQEVRGYFGRKTERLKILPRIILSSSKRKISPAFSDYHFVMVETMQRCIRCYQCVRAAVGDYLPVRCPVNPGLGFEYIPRPNTSHREKG